MEPEISGELPCSSIAVDAVLRLGTAGIIWGSCYGLSEADKLGIAGIARASFLAKSVGKYGIQWGKCSNRGAVAGAALGAGTRSWKQVAGITGLACALYHAVDVAKSHEN